MRAVYIERSLPKRHPRSWGTGIRLVLALATGVACSALCGGTAQAEIGKATASPGEWFLGFNFGSADTSGAKRQVALISEDISPRPVYSELLYDDGTLLSGGLEGGYVFAESSFLDRIEINVDVAAISRDAGTFTGIAQFRNSQGGGTLSDRRIAVEGDDSQTEVEARLSFKTTLIENGGGVVVASLEPFLRYQEAVGKAELYFSPPFGGFPGFQRRDSIEAYYVGLQGAAEFELPLAESLNLVGRASAGFYHVDSDIDDVVGVENGMFLGGAEDSASTFGGRFGAALGFKIPLAAASLTIVGTVDYHTDIATIEHLKAYNTGITRADFDDRLDVGAKAAFIIPLR